MEQQIPDEDEDYFAMHGDEPMTEKEYYAEMEACARFTFGKIHQQSAESIHANYIIANEHLNLKEFLEDYFTKEEWDIMYKKFIEKQGKSNIEGYKKVGYKLDYQFPVKL